MKGLDTMKSAASSVAPTVLEMDLPVQLESGMLTHLLEVVSGIVQPIQNLAVVAQFRLKLCCLTPLNHAAPWGNHG